MVEQGIVPLRVLGLISHLGMITDKLFGIPYLDTISSPKTIYKTFMKISNIHYLGSISSIHGFQIAYMTSTLLPQKHVLIQTINFHVVPKNIAKI